MLLTDQIVPKFADLCSYWANKIPLLCVPRLFLKQLKEQKAKTREHYIFEKEMFPRVSSLKIQFSSCKKQPNNTKDKNAIENNGVLT